MKRLAKPRFIGLKYASNSEVDLCCRLSGRLQGPIRRSIGGLRRNLRPIRRLSLFRTSRRFMWKS